MVSEVRNMQQNNGQKCVLYERECIGCLEIKDDAVIKIDKIIINDGD